MSRIISQQPGREPNSDGSVARSWELAEINSKSRTVPILNLLSQGFFVHPVVAMDSFVETTQADKLIMRM